MLDEMAALQAKIDALYKKLEIEINTKKVLEELGFPIQEKGCVYLILAVKMAIKKDFQPFIYENLAQIYEITSEEVKNEIELVISKWWQRERFLRLNDKSKTKCNVFSEIKPTSEEFIAWLTDTVKDLGVK